MIAATKIAACAAAGTTIVGGSVVLAREARQKALDYDWFLSYETGDDTKEPGWTPLSSESNSEDTYKDKYVYKYLKYFTSAIDSSNTEWWDWTYKMIYLRHSEGYGEFKNLKSGDELKNKCKSVYSATNVQNHEKHLWKFCSSVVEKIDTISESNNGVYYTQTGTYGHDLKNVLVSVYSHSRGNSGFWDLKDKEFFKEKDESANGSEFYKLYEQQTEKQFLLSYKIKGQCERAYYYVGEDRDTKFPEDLVYKYCSLKGSK